MKPVVGIDAHKESCTYVVRHWNKTLAGPTRIPSTRAALTKLAKQYSDHDFVLEVCAVHEWMVDLLRETARIPSPWSHPEKARPERNRTTMMRRAWLRSTRQENWLRSMLGHLSCAAYATPSASMSFSRRVGSGLTII